MVELPGDDRARARAVVVDHLVRPGRVQSAAGYRAWVEPGINTPPLELMLAPAPTMPINRARAMGYYPQSDRRPRSA